MTEITTGRAGRLLLGDIVRRLELRYVESLLTLLKQAQVDFKTAEAEVRVNDSQGPPHYELFVNGQNIGIIRSGT